MFEDEQPLNIEEAFQLPEREYILFCDESDREGKFFSCFYGGVLVAASHYQAVTDRLNTVKATENLAAEVKWQKVSASYLGKYQKLIAAFFDEMASGHLKVRIMFRQNAQEPKGLSPEQIKLEYWMLYYQFVKHAFGFGFLEAEGLTHLRVYFDRFPTTGEQAAQFKGYIEALEKSPQFRRAQVKIRNQDVTEVDSKDHVLLQCLDVVLGSICFRLNDKHKLKPADAHFRGARTIAKEKLYNDIRQSIRDLLGMPHFNVGITTGGEIDRRWKLPHCHWKFTPKEFKYDETKTKSNQK